MKNKVISPRIGVIGDGSWGTAIVKILAENTEKINWWVKDDYVKNYIKINSYSPKHLTSIKFNPNQLNITTDINQLIEDSDYIIVVVPSIYIKSCFEKINTNLTGKTFFSAVKGIIPEDLLPVVAFLHKKMGIPFENIGNIMGPCHAEEVSFQRLSYLTVSATDSVKAKQLQEMLNCAYIKTTESNDLLGTEYAAVLKNIYSIACGIANGLGYGDNFQAVLMSNAIREMEYFLSSVVPMKNRPINNSVYLGDLLVTGYSYFSRNRSLGNMIGKGYTVRSAIVEMNMVPEGYYASKGIYKLIEEMQLTMPICKSVHKILHKSAEPREVFNKLSTKLS
jgi:glycerol-3-phosphate dehydrogenase (NAD(P)+)